MLVFLIFSFLNLVKITDALYNLLFPFFGNISDILITY